MASATTRASRNGWRGQGYEISDDSLWRYGSRDGDVTIVRALLKVDLNDDDIIRRWFASHAGQGAGGYAHCGAPRFSANSRDDYSVCEL
jgi:hypothetical protein